MFHGRIDSLPLTKGLAGGVYEEHSGYIPPFLERMFIRIYPKTMSCKISKIFSGGKNLVSQPFLNEEIWFLMFLIKKKTERIIFGVC